MSLHLSIFFQGLPFIIFLTFLFVTKRNNSKFVWINYFLPTILYYILIVYGQIFFIDEEGYSLQFHVMVVNLISAFGIYILFKKEYNDYIIIETIESKYHYFLKRKAFSNIYFRGEIFDMMLRSVEGSMKYLFIPKKELQKIIFDVISKVHIRENTYDDRKNFLNSKLIPEEEFNYFYETLDEVMCYILKKNNLKFLWKFLEKKLKIQIMEEIYDYFYIFRNSSNIGWYFLKENQKIEVMEEIFEKTKKYFLEHFNR